MVGHFAEFCREPSRSGDRSRSLKPSYRTDYIKEQASSINQVSFENTNDSIHMYNYTFLFYSNCNDLSEIVYNMLSINRTINITHPFSLKGYLLVFVFHYYFSWLLAVPFLQNKMILDLFGAVLGPNNSSFWLTPALLSYWQTIKRNCRTVIQDVTVYPEEVLQGYGSKKPLDVECSFKAYISVTGCVKPMQLTKFFVIKGRLRHSMQAGHSAPWTIRTD